MPAIILTQPMIQSLLAKNKQLIRSLETDRAYTQHRINQLWLGCDPIDTHLTSTVGFTMLNSAKDDLRAIRKEIKMLAEIQYSLKHPVDFA